ncbi:MAG: OmpA family protein [Desulfuromonadales bacterium]|nr:OmpA family protein [Desulfuromonadales bacterium]
MEAYASYPSLLFNGDEDTSGRGYATAGFKFRVWGKRSSPFKVALDTQARLTVSDVSEFNGLTDLAGRLVTSLNLGTFGVHANAGYVYIDSPESIDFDNQLLFGGGVEYFPVTRLRLLAEFSYETAKIDGDDDPSEAMVGAQYYITPHLTVNAGLAMGLSDGSPDWRALFGFSTCQGVGTYNRPVPKLVDPKADIEDKNKKKLKVSKVKTLTPLLSNKSAAGSPVSHLEVPLKDPGRKVVVDPSSRLKSPQIPSHDVSPVSPLGTLRPVKPSDRLPQGPFPAKVKRRFRLPDFTFDTNQWDLSDQGRKALSLVAEELRQERIFFILSIEGHTDDVGSASYNELLSFKRSVAAATHLVLHDGVDPSLIFVKGHGEAYPLAPNTTEEGRSKNRRVELLVLIPEGQERKLRTPQKEASVVTPIEGNDNASVIKGPVIDALSIEEAIMEKTGAETAKPAGAISQIDTAKE